MAANSTWPKYFPKQKLTWIDLTIFIALSVNIHVLLQKFQYILLQFALSYPPEHVKK